MLLLALLATAEARLANVRAHEDLAAVTTAPDAKTTTLPKSFSWRDHDLLAPSWNQHVPRYCGACFAFATAWHALRALGPAAPRNSAAQGEEARPRVAAAVELQPTPRQISSY